MPLLEPRAPYRPRHRSKHHPLGMLTIGTTLGVLVVGVSIAAPAHAPGARPVGPKPVPAGRGVIRLTDQPAFPIVASSPGRTATISPSPTAGTTMALSAPQGPAQ